MPLPTILFGIFLSTLEGAIYHFIRGGSSRKLLYYLVLSWLGFWLGDSIGYYFGWSILLIGLLNAGMGMIVSFIFLVFGDFLSAFGSNIQQEDE